MLSVAEASFPPELVRDSSTPLRSAQNDRAINHSRERGKMSFKTTSKKSMMISVSTIMWEVAILTTVDFFESPNRPDPRV